MFTGIVQEVGTVAAAYPNRLAVNATRTLKGMELGGSIAVNGACLTITRFDSNSFSVDIMPETMKRTNLELLSPGDKVNLERPLALGGELGGHLVLGHIDTTGVVSSVTDSVEAILITFKAPAELMRFVVEKGFIAVDGVSLTVVTRDNTSFQVSIVGYTKKNTTLGNRKAGNKVNLEADTIAKYVEQISQKYHSGITADFLQEHGFLVG